MFLALKEMRRAKVRFALLMAAVGLLVFLILFQQSLQNGLITAFVGAVRNQSAPVLVYSVDGRRVIQGSVIGADLEAAVREAVGDGRVGRIGQGTFTVTAADELSEATVLGFEEEGLGSPTTLVSGRLPRSAGEAVASEADAAAGFDIGDVVRVEPGGLELRVVGLARDIQLNVAPTLFVPYATYLDAVRSRNPDAGVPPPNVLAVVPAPGTTPAATVAAVNAASDDLDALTRADAAAKTPGVAQVQQSFQVIFLLYGLVVPLVTGLFFLIVTFQKAPSLTLLRAIGAPAGRLVSALLVQVLLVVGGGLVIGIGLYAPLSVQRIGGITLRFETAAVIGWSIALLVLGTASSAVSARRVVGIDPAAALGGAGVDR